MSKVLLLRQWYDCKGKFMTTSYILSGQPNTVRYLDSNRKGLSVFQHDDMKILQKPTYFTVMAYISNAKSFDAIYECCPTKNCNRKLAFNSYKTFYCEKCDLQTCQPLYKYVVNMSIMDSQSTTWLTAFDDQAEALLGKSASKLKSLSKQDEQLFQTCFKNLDYKPCVFKLRSKTEYYKGSSRVRSTLVKWLHIDYNAESCRLLKEIESMTGKSF